VLRNYLPRCVPLSLAVRELIDLAIREKDITPPVRDSAERLRATNPSTSLGH